jgi:hypothetical protein
MSRSTILATALLLAGIASTYFLSNRSAQEAFAMTAHGTEKKSMVTVPLDGGMEAVVALDHITCDLTGYVLDRFSGQFFIQYRYNVARDFPLRQGNLPRFVMLAGQADFRQFSGNERIADGVIYIAEEASGQVVAYGIPWNSQFRVSTTGPQRRSFVPLDFAKTRFIELEQ